MELLRFPGRQFISNISVCLPALLVVALSPISALAQTVDPIVVNVTSVTSDISRHPIGLDTDWLMDVNSRRTSGSPTFSSVLESMGAKYLRWPGGEEGNDLLWSVSPYTSPTPTLALPGPNRAFPNTNSDFVSQTDYTTLVTPYGFAQFMTDCQAVSCVPVMMVTLRPYLQTADTSDPVPTRSQLITTAVALVKYANVTNNYGIKYWEIGNEYWDDNSSFTGPAESQSAYIQDVEDFSTAMKAVDPTIQIGANGQSESDILTILQSAASYIDFVVVHPYPTWFDSSGFITFDFSDYQTDNTWAAGVQDFEAAINDPSISAANRARLKVAVTETNALTGGSLGVGTSPGDLWHGMALFEILGQQMSEPLLNFTQVWSSHWVNDYYSSTDGEDTIDQNNSIAPTGEAVAIWGNYLEEQLVGIANPTSDPLVHAFASYNQHNGDLNVFLVNKDTSAHTANVSLQNYAASSDTASRSIFSGSSATDTAPTFAAGSAITVSSNSFSVSLPGPSIVVVSLQGSSVQGLNLLSNPGFETGLLNWSQTGTVAVSQQANRGMQAVLISPSGALTQSVTLSGSTCQMSAFGLANGSGTTGYIGISGTLAGSPWKQYLSFTSNTYTQETLSFDLPSGLSSTSAFVSASGGSGNFLADDTFLSCSANSNLLANPGFESGLSDWTSHGTVSTTTNAYSGSSAVDITPSASLSQSVSLSVGNCSLSGYGYSSGSGTTGYAGVSGTLDGATWKPDVTINGSAYGLLVVPFSVPSGVTSTSAFLSASGGSGNIFADQVELVCGTTPNIVSNPGFESGLAGWTSSGTTGLTSSSNSGSDALQLSAGGSVEQYLSPTGISCTLSGFGKVSGTGLTGYFGINGTIGRTAWQEYASFTGTTYGQQSIQFSLPAGLQNSYFWAKNSNSSGTVDVDDLFLSCL